MLRIPPPFVDRPRPAHQLPRRPVGGERRDGRRLEPETRSRAGSAESSPRPVTRTGSSLGVKQFHRIVEQHRGRRFGKPAGPRLARVGPRHRFVAQRSEGDALGGTPTTAEHRHLHRSAPPIRIRSAPAVAVNQ